MAIKSNSSTEQVAGSGITLYSGLTNMKVVAVNPSMKELHAMEIKVKQEPNYSVSFNNEDYNKVVFWLGNEDTTVKMEILTQPKARVSQSGKNQWINNVGQSTWSESSPSYEWWKNEGEHHAFVGEETLINFVKSWANVANGDEVSFETTKKIANGDVAEIKALVGVLGTNEVRVLVGVKDDKYQTVYSKHFGRVKPQRDDFFIRNLNDDYGSFNADFNADLAWGEHTPTINLLAADVGTKKDDDADWSMPDAPLTEGDTAKSPF